MRYIIWHKFIYLLFIIGDLVATLIIIIYSGEELAHFPYIYISGLNAFISAPPLIKSALFLSINIFFLSRILNENFDTGLLSLEQLFSIGRMLMIFAFALIPVNIYLPFWIVSPVANSLWGLISSISTDMSFMRVACSILLGLEVVYIILLSRNKNCLNGTAESTSTHGIPENTPPDDNSGNGKKHFIPSSLHWQMGVITFSWKLCLLGLACIGLLVIIGLLTIFGKPEKPTTIEQLVALESDESRTYRLEIPKAYLIHAKGNGVTLKAAYPGMVSFSPEIRHRFYNKNDRGADDSVRITINNFGPITSDYGAFKNRNDRGRLALHNRILYFPDSYKQVPVTEPIEESDKIVKYAGAQHKGLEGEYVITHGDQRVSVISCISNKTCVGLTTWNGELGIEYTMKRKHLKKMVDLDRSVIALINDFKPTQLKKEE